MLQIIERQELTDSKVRAALHAPVHPGGGGGRNGAKARRNGGKGAGQAGGGGGIDTSRARVRCWYAMAIEAVEEYIDAKFTMLCSSLVEVLPVDVGVLIEGHAKIVDDIVAVKDLVEPCFPPQYRIFDLFVARNHARLVELVKALMATHAALLTPADIISIVHWLRDYHGQLEGLGAAPTPVLTDDLGALLQGYNYQIETMMREWSGRMLQEDLRSQPESTAAGASAVCGGAHRPVCVYI